LAVAVVAGGGGKSAALLARLHGLMGLGGGERNAASAMLARLDASERARALSSETGTPATAPK